MISPEMLGYIAAIIMFCLTILGIALNGSFFKVTMSRPQYAGAFYLFCRTRAVANILMASIFLFWAVPSSFLGRIILPKIFNSIFGQFAGWGVFIIGPLIQFFISVNRFVACCFPMYFRNYSGTRISRAAIGVSIFIGIIYFSLGFIQPNCTFLYDVSIHSWVPEKSECAWILAYFIFYSVASLFGAASIMNLSSFIMLMRFAKIRNAVSDARVNAAKDRRNWKLLVQNILQDSFFIIDLMAVTYAINISSEAWYQFFINSVLWLLQIIGDGVIMLMMTDRKILGSKRPSKNVSVPTRIDRDRGLVASFQQHNLATING